MNTQEQQHIDNCRLLESALKPSTFVEYRNWVALWKSVYKEETRRARAYCRWHREGYMGSHGTCFDIGNTVRNALDNFRLHGKANSGSKDPDSAGNGSVMRLAPVPMYFGSDADAAIEHSGKSSLTTHGATTCVDACRYLGGLLWGALNGASKEDMLSPRFIEGAGRLVAA